MKFYFAFYQNKRIEVEADSSHEAQQKAAKILKTDKSYDIFVIPADLIVRSTQYI